MTVTEGKYLDYQELMVSLKISFHLYVEVSVNWFKKIKSLDPGGRKERLYYIKISPDDWRE